MSKRRAITSIIIIWICAVIFALPTLLFSQTENYENGDELRTLCIVIWPGKPLRSKMREKTFSANSLSLTFSLADGPAGLGHSQLDYM